jgi:hypothetical protein
MTLIVASWTNLRNRSSRPIVPTLSAVRLLSTGASVSVRPSCMSGNGLLNPFPGRFARTIISDRSESRDLSCPRLKFFARTIGPVPGHIAEIRVGDFIRFPGCVVRPDQLPELFSSDGFLSQQMAVLKLRHLFIKTLSLIFVCPQAARVLAARHSASLIR